MFNMNIGIDKAIAEQIREAIKVLKMSENGRFLILRHKIKITAIAVYKINSTHTRGTRIKFEIAKERARETIKEEIAHTSGRLRKKFTILSCLS